MQTVYINVVTACLWNIDNVCVCVYVSLRVCVLVLHHQPSIQSKNSLVLGSYWILSALPLSFPTLLISPECC